MAPTYTCGTCAHFQNVVRDSATTGASFDARTCNCPEFFNVMGKCPREDTPGCIHHTELRKESGLPGFDEQINAINFPFFNQCVSEASALHSVKYALSSWLQDLALNLNDPNLANTLRTFPFNQFSPGPIAQFIAAILMTNPDQLRVEINNIIDGALRTYVSVPLQETLELAHENTQKSLTMVERRCTPLQDEIDELRARLEALEGRPSDVDPED